MANQHLILVIHNKVLFMVAIKLKKVRNSLQTIAVTLRLHKKMFFRSLKGIVIRKVLNLNFTASQKTRRKTVLFQ